MSPIKRLAVFRYRSKGPVNKIFHMYIFLKETNVGLSKGHVIPFDSHKIVPV